MSNISQVDDLTKPTNLDEWVEYIQTLNVRSIDLGLERVVILAERLGIEPKNSIAKKTITVTGTNGKGSTVATLEALSSSCGQRYGSFSSPHLIAFNERIRINGRPVDDTTLIDTFTLIDTVREDVALTFFEFNALAAFTIFKNNQLDVAILEVGMGGRLDATNFIDADQLIMTNIAIDHVAWLGDTRDKIGYEKAGLMRRGQHVYFGEKDCPQSVLDRSRELKVQWHQFGTDWNYRNQSEDTWVYCDDNHTWTLPKPNLQGQHQLTNAAISIRAFTDLMPQMNGELTETQVVKALQLQFLPGRLDRRVIDGRNWTFEVGHNPAAIATITDYLRDQDNTNLTAIITFLKDKDAEPMIEALAPYVSNWLGVSLDMKRGRTVEGITELLSDYDNVVVVSSPENAVLAVNSGEIGQNDIIVIGSFYLVGDIMRALGEAAYGD